MGTGYIHLHEWLMFYDKYRDFFPYMDPMGYSFLKEISASVIFCSTRNIFAVFAIGIQQKFIVTLGPPRLRFPQHVQLVFGWVDLTQVRMQLSAFQIHQGKGRFRRHAMVQLS